MALTGKGSSLLVVSGGQTSFNAIRSVVQTTFSRIVGASSMAQARQIISKGGIDTIIINTPVPDEFGVDAALDLAARNHSLCILVLIKAEQYEQVCYKTKGSGILLLTRPLKGQMLLEGARLLVSMRERMEILEENNKKLKRRLDDMSIVTRAKCLLIEKKHMTEEEAHYYLEREAMDGSQTKREIAESLIAELGDDT